jgi:N-acetylneuraminic acid mutarotase
MLPANDALSITIGNVHVSKDPGSSAKLDVYYVNFDQPKPLQSREVQLLIQNPPGDHPEAHISASVNSDSIEITPSQVPPIQNTISLDLVNDEGVAIKTTPDSMFYLSFIYGEAPGYGALTPKDSSLPGITVTQPGGDGWDVRPDTSQETPFWKLQPKGKVALGTSASDTAVFEISGITVPSDFDPGPTTLFIEWRQLADYRDGHTKVILQKQIPKPSVTLKAAKDFVDYDTNPVLAWQSVAVPYLQLSYSDGQRTVFLPAADGKPLPLQTDQTKGFVVPNAVRENTTFYLKGYKDAPPVGREPNVESIAEASFTVTVQNIPSVTLQSGGIVDYDTNPVLKWQTAAVPHLQLSYAPYGQGIVFLPATDGNPLPLQTDPITGFVVPNAIRQETTFYLRGYKDAPPLGQQPNVAAIAEASCTVAVQHPLPKITFEVTPTIWPFVTGPTQVTLKWAVDWIEPSEEHSIEITCSGGASMAPTAPLPDKASFPVQQVASPQKWTLKATGSGGRSATAATGVDNPHLEPAASMKTERCKAAAILLPSGKVLIAGGETNNANASLSSTEIYDPDTNTFAGSTPSMNTGRSGATATLLSNGKVLIAGGWGLGSGYYISGPLSTTEIYDPDKNTFAGSTPSMNTGRSGATATLLSNGKVLIAGGWGWASNSLVTSPLSTTEIYDPDKNTFASFTPSMNTARIDATATLLPNGNVLIAGGSPSDLDYGIRTTEIYDPTANSFKTSPNMNDPHTKATATPLSNGNVLIAGGQAFSLNDFEDVCLSSTEIYDSGTHRFRNSTPSLRTARSMATATLLSNGKVLVVGGQDSNSAHLSSIEIYDPVSNSFAVSIRFMNTPRSLAIATLLRNGKVLIAGGFNEGGLLRSTELYTPEE